LLFDAGFDCGWVWAVDDDDWACASFEFNVDISSRSLIDVFDMFGSFLDGDLNFKNKKNIKIAWFQNK
jgi:hypothetical protein